MGATEIPACVQRDAVQPRPESRLASEASEGAVGAQERLLHRVLRILLVAQQPPGEAEQPGCVALYQQDVRVRVPRLCRDHQRHIVPPHGRIISALQHPYIRRAQLLRDASAVSASGHCDHCILCGYKQSTACACTAPHRPRPELGRRSTQAMRMCYMHAAAAGRIRLLSVQEKPLLLRWEYLGQALYHRHRC